MKPPKRKEYSILDCKNIHLSALGYISPKFNIYHVMLNKLNGWKEIGWQSKGGDIYTPM